MRVNAQPSIGSVAKAADVNVETIRYYQRRGLLSYAAMRQDAGQAISAATRTLITIDETDVDTDSIVSGNTFVVPSAAGFTFIEITVQIRMTQSSAATTPRLEITRNSTTLTVADADGGAFVDWEDTGTETAHSLTFSVACSDGDVFRIPATNTNAATAKKATDDESAMGV